MTSSTVSSMTSSERVFTALGHKEPDRVPLFLLLTLHGAKELGLSVREYFSKAEYVAEGQLRLRKKFHNDCIYTFFYAPLEIEAWGGEVIYAEDGPPNSGQPFIRKPEQISSLCIPQPGQTACLQKVLRSIEMLKEKVGDEVPIIGVVMSPFSLPVMQMGFESYLRLIYEEAELFAHLMKINEEFCVQWANAQLSAGATAICYFDPVSSPTIVPREMFLKTGFEIAKRTISRIQGPVATHLASGRCLPILDDIAKTGAAVVGVSCLEDLGEIRSRCKGGLNVLGNLNGIAMSRWTAEEAENEVKQAIRSAGGGGGFILSDNHGEIPFQVSDEILWAISHAVRKWGTYPLSPSLYE